jgi:hypothetical protein
VSTGGAADSQKLSVNFLKQSLCSQGFWQRTEGCVSRRSSAYHIDARADGFESGAFTHSPRGGRKNKTRKRRASAPARKKKYVRTFPPPFFFKVRFGAFLGKGSSKTREKKLSTFQKKNHRGNIFSGGIFLLGDFL